MHKFIAFILITIGSFYVLPLKTTLATVGGPTYIERLSYSQTENSLYYLINNKGGRGCPPEIEKMNLATKERTLILSCDKIETDYYTKDGFNSTSYDQFVEKTFSSLTSLSMISLPNNNISTSVDYIGEHKFDEYNTSSNFKATISQNNTEKGTTEFMGCHQDQLNVFRGYLIPNTNTIAMLISRVGDCFEGGYTKDDLYILENINIQDTTPTGYSNYYPGPQIHHGNLVVSTQNTNITQTDPSEQTKEKNFSYIWKITTLTITLFLGYIIGRKTKKP